jgi:hypothetical protein
MSRRLLLVACVGACSAPAPPSPRVEVVAYAPPPLAAGGRGAGAERAWRVAIPALPGDVAPTTPVPTLARRRASPSEGAEALAVAVMPAAPTLGIADWAALDGEWSGGIGLVGAGTEDGSGTIGTSPRRKDRAGQLGTIGVAPSKAARVKVRAPTVRGGLPAELVQRVLIARAATLVGCFADQAATFDATFLIARNGSVQAVDGEGGAPTVAPCVAKAIKAIEFPRVDEESRVTVRLAFMPAGQ